MAKVIFHIGLPKTATTTLQLYLFHMLGKEGKINFIGRYMTAMDNSYYFKISDVINSVLIDSDSEFESKVDMHIFEINKYLKEETLNVISEEMLTISYIDRNDIMSISRNLERIQRIFLNHEIKILLSLRRQDKIVYSFYVEFYPTEFFKDNKNSTLDKYIINGLREGKKGNFNMFYYSEIIKKSNELFGKGSTEVLVFEDINNNKSRYISTISKCLEVPYDQIAILLDGHQVNIKNKSNDGYKSEKIGVGNYIRFILNKFIPVSIKKTLFLKKIYNYIIKKLNAIKLHSTEIPYCSDIQKKLILAEFEKTNKEVDNLYNLELYKYDYYKK